MIIKQKVPTILSLTFILSLVFFRFYHAIQLDQFYIDELTRAGLIKALLTDGIPPETKRLGLFFVFTDADFADIFFITPALIWARIFGYSFVSLRIFSSLLTIGGIVLLGKAVSLWYDKSLKIFLMVTIIGLIMPWNYLQGMLFWGPTLTPLYMIIAFWSFSRLANPKENEKHYLPHFLFPISLIAIVYTYRVAGFVAVGMYIFMYAYLIHHKFIVRKQIFTALTISIATSLPLVIAALGWSDFWSRSSYNSLFSFGGFKTQVYYFVQSIDKLFSLEFLFFLGDNNYRHHSGANGGMIGLGVAIPLFALIYFAFKNRLGKNETFLTILSLFGIALSFFGTALTNPHDNPHSLRSNCAWVFIVILAGIGLINLHKAKTKTCTVLFILTYITMFLFSIYYLYHFSTQFLPGSGYWFHLEQGYKFADIYLTN